MTVQLFPAPEPWPAEFFDQFGIADLEQLVADVNAAIAARRAAAGSPVCARCFEYATGDEPDCLSCGYRLYPYEKRGRSAAVLAKEEQWTNS